MTHAELRAAVDELAGLLRQIGEPGARIGLVAENGPFFVTAYLAAIQAGRCVVPMPTAPQAEWLRQVVEATEMSLVLASARAARDEDLQTVLTAAGVDTWVERDGDGLRVDAAESDAPRADEPEIDPGTDLAALFFTSGSTGEPKGVMVTHRNIETNTRDIVDYLELVPGDRAMVVLPLHYCYGLSVLHSHLAAGGSVVINNLFMFPEKVLDDIVATECTNFAGVPSHYQILLRKTRFAEREFPRLRLLQQAGGKLPEPFLRELVHAHPDIEMFVMYGQTEATARLSYLPPQCLGDKLGSVGQGLPSTILEVIDEAGKPVVPGSGDVGEIVATGDNVTAGYWRDPETTARYFEGSRLRTRDLATVDEDGFIFIVDRARDFIKSMGNRISPKEIEDVIAEMPQVVEVAVIGVPDEIWGEAVRAVVVPADSTDFDEARVKAHCNERLPNHKVPSQVEIAASLPKSESGKVLKAALRAQVAEPAAVHGGADG